MDKLQSVIATIVKSPLGDAEKLAWVEKFSNITSQEDFKIKLEELAQFFDSFAEKYEDEVRLYDKYLAILEKFQMELSQVQQKSLTVPVAAITASTAVQASSIQPANDNPPQPVLIQSVPSSYTYAPVTKTFGAQSSVTVLPQNTIPQQANNQPVSPVSSSQVVNPVSAIGVTAIQPNPQTVLPPVNNKSVLPATPVQNTPSNKDLEEINQVKQTISQLQSQVNQPQ